jgi:hypothetical protein
LLTEESIGMTRIVWDVEANGLLDTVSKVHCLVLKNIDTGEVIRLYGSGLTKENIIHSFTKFKPKKIIGHNIIGYDIPLLRKMYSIDLIDLLGPDAIVDTYLWSQVSFPDRPMPRGCPEVLRSSTGKSKRIGPHGLESWGWRVGERKIEINDWSTFDESMLNRCEVDVNINERVYYALLDEMGMKDD